MQEVINTEKAISFHNKLMKLNFIKSVVSAYYKQPLTDFDRKTRKQEVVMLKSVAMYLSYHYGNVKNKSDIGSVFRCTHCNVIHAIKKIDGYIQFDKELSSQIKELGAMIQHKVVLIDDSIDLVNDYFYVNANDCTAIKITQEKAVILVGFSDSEIDNMLLIDRKSKESHISEDSKLMEFNNTNIYLLKKIHKPTK